MCIRITRKEIRVKSRTSEEDNNLKEHETGIQND